MSIAKIELYSSIQVCSIERSQQQVQHTVELCSPKGETFIINLHLHCLEQAKLCHAVLSESDSQNPDYIRNLGNSTIYWPLCVTITPPGQLGVCISYFVHIVCLHTFRANACIHPSLQHETAVYPELCKAMYVL